MITCASLGTLYNWRRGYSWSCTLMLTQKLEFLHKEIISFCCWDQLFLQPTRQKVQKLRSERGSSDSSLCSFTAPRHTGVRAPLKITLARSPSCGTTIKPWWAATCGRWRLYSVREGSFPPLWSGSLWINNRLGSLLPPCWKSDLVLPIPSVICSRLLFSLYPYPPPVL